MGVYSPHSTHARPPAKGEGKGAKGVVDGSELYPPLRNDFPTPPDSQEKEGSGGEDDARE